jgi:hypothetical protein
LILSGSSSKKMTHINEYDNLLIPVLDGRICPEIKVQKRQNVSSVLKLL